MIASLVLKIMSRQTAKLVIYELHEIIAGLLVA